MGAGIAHAFLVADADVVIIERTSADAAAAHDRVLRVIEAGLTRGAGGDPDAMRSRLSTGTEVALFSDRSLVIEAVPEDKWMKIEALRRVEGVLEAAAVLASNTSSISIDALATELDRPHRFLGLHFFNPVPASGLVEIVVGSQTDDAVVAAAAGWVDALGKVPVTVHDAPGFASSRLGVALGLEAIRMLEQGVASAEDIDAAMVLGYRHPVGPLRLTDIVGLDVRLGIADYLAGELGDRFAAPELLRTLVAEGKLGRKTGQGFYTWDAQ
jgi:3-hydroxybutyryl-CoA dehydrogenase